MKKHTFFLIITLFVYLSSNAQTRNGFGIHAGVNTSSFYNIDGAIDDYEPMSGYQVGVRYNAKLGPIGFSPEINYTSMKTKYGGILPSNVEETITANYISVPLLLKLYISGLNVYFGAQASYLIGGEYTDSDSSYSFTDDIYYETVNGTEYWYFQEIDIAGVLGIGWDTKMGLYASCRSVFSLNPFANINLGNAIQAAAGLPDLSTDYINELERWVSVQFLVGYKF